MNIIKPFRGITYNQKKIKKLSKVLAPPYDTISDLKQSELYLKSSFNIVRLIYGLDLDNDNDYENKYTRAKQYLEQWLSSEILTQDPVPCFYIYAQEYNLYKKTYTRWGFIGLYKLQPKNHSMIFPHEETYSAPKEDRLNLIKNVKSNLSSVFTLYPDSDNITDYIKSMCERWQPYIDTVFDGVRHKMWKIRDTVSINNIYDSMSKKQLFVADGHHRLEVAYKYQSLANKNIKIKGDNPFDYTMMYFTSLNDIGLSILPTHRLVKLENKKDMIKKISRLFIINEFNSLPALKKKMQKDDIKDTNIIGIFDGKKYYSATLKNDTSLTEKLDVVILHDILFKKCLSFKSYKDKNLCYSSFEKEVVEKIKNKEFDVAFLLNPVKIKQLQNIVREGKKLPQKTTFFYPKVISGLTIYKF